MQLTSPAFEHTGMIPSVYTCDGENRHPELIFSDVPAHTQSLVLFMEDPDVPRHIREDGMWDHWVVFNLPAGCPGIREGEAPPGTLGANTRGAKAYGGPCPPDREHRYFFKLYALDTHLALPEGASKADVLGVMDGHVLAEAELMGRYRRP